MIGRLSVLVLMLAYCMTADAYGSLRCKGKFIRLGATMSEVLSLCGEPRSRVVEQVPVRSGSVSGFSRLSGITVAETWEYDRGWGRFAAVLRFREGELWRVDYLRYRSGKR